MPHPVYFIASDGSPCDNGSRVVIDANEFPANQTICVGTIGETGEVITSICSVHAFEEKTESQQIMKNNLRDTLTLLRESSIITKIKEFRIVKTPHIENII